MSNGQAGEQTDDTAQQEEVKGWAVAVAPQGVAQGSWCVMEGTP